MIVNAYNNTYRDVRYYTKTDSDSKYQVKFTALSPLLLNSDNALSIDPTIFYNKLGTDNKYQIKIYHSITFKLIRVLAY